MSINIAFEENGQLVPKHKDDVCYTYSKDEHIQWLVERLDVDLDIIVESPSSTKWFFFDSHAMYLSFLFQKPF